ncbi:MAG: hypothetical protein D6718_13600 [Acidobacteria bacterium]|nr:MAG: hypothetical protein D6718_13600 [Acidobacteriota bacterium]
MEKAKARPERLLRSLGLHGLDHLDPIVLAALADERPLLLIGPHGTGKSELLNRIAAALGLEHRHYNASLISFDDLLGYPMPDAERKRIEFVETPASIWGAESVFLDEISRCRPETQNKLFSLVHERKVQGVPLPKLRYRWAAMNPPCTDESDKESEEIYAGSLPLDPALADRFAYVVTVPGIYEMSVRARRALIATQRDPGPRGTDLRELVRRTRDHLADSHPLDDDWLEAWTDALLIPLREAGFPISGRRAVFLVRSARSVWAACKALRIPARLDDAAFEALASGLPHPAYGRRPTSSVLRSIHNAACQTAGENPSSVWHAIRAEIDPSRRAILAAKAPPGSIGRDELSSVLCDCLARSTKPERYLLSILLSPLLADGDRINAPALEILTQPLSGVLAFSVEESHHQSMSRAKAHSWSKVLSTVTALQKSDDPDRVELANALMTLFLVEKETFDPDALVARFRELRELLRGDGRSLAA